MLIECSMEDFIDYIADDPVRPHLFEDNVTRFEKKFRVFADVDKQGFDMKVNAIVCTVMCPVEALRMDRDTMKVNFDSSKCIVCGACIKSYPPGAMKLDF